MAAPGRPYLRVASTTMGLFLVGGKDRAMAELGNPGDGGAPTRASVVRQGPYAVSLRFEGATPLPPGPPIRWTATMTFPSSKTWVETTLTVDDPEGLVVDFGATIGLAVGKGPTLVDFGAGSIVYGQIKGRESMELGAGEAPGLGRLDPRGHWTVSKGVFTEPTGLFAVPAAGDDRPAEGWAHVMDESRCTALAVADFGRTTRDSIRVAADGLTIIGRTFQGGDAPPVRGRKTLTFWCHFVPMPVQVGAATSPQAMLAPLQVTWEPGPA